MRESSKGALQMILSISLILIFAAIFEINNILPPFYIWYPLVFLSFLVTVKGAIKFVSKGDSE